MKDKSKGIPCTPDLNLSTTYFYDNPEDLASAFALDSDGYIYSRINNPTVTEVEKRVAKIEHGIGALAAATGHAALCNVVFSLCRSGDYIVSSNAVYGGTYNLFNHTLQQTSNITTEFVDPTNIEQLIDVCTKLRDAHKDIGFLFVESISNPGQVLADLQAWRDVADAFDIPLVVDNTLLTGVLLDVSSIADIIIMSGSKFYNGHSLGLSGFIIDTGRMSWSGYPAVDFNDVTYHDINYYEKFGKNAFLVKTRVKCTRDFGNYLDPSQAWILLNTLETLELRVLATASNAEVIFTRLNHWTKVKYLMGGVGTFTLPSRDLANKFMNLCSIPIAAHLGSTRTMLNCPSLTTHAQLSDFELSRAGIEPGEIRLSIGLESPQDVADTIISVFKQLGLVHKLEGYN